MTTFYVGNRVQARYALITRSYPQEVFIKAGEFGVIIDVEFNFPAVKFDNGKVCSALPSDLRLVDSEKQIIYRLYIDTGLYEADMTIGYYQTREAAERASQEENEIWRTRIKISEHEVQE